MSSSERKFLLYSAVFVAVLVVAFIPVFCVTVVPEWKVSLVYSDGTPATGVPLQESWNENLGTEASFKAVDECIRVNSDITFPSRKRCGVSVAAIALAKAENTFIGLGSPGSLEPVARISCCGGHRCEAFYFDGGEVPARIEVSLPDPDFNP